MHAQYKTFDDVCLSEEDLLRCQRIRVLLHGILTISSHISCIQIQCSIIKSLGSTQFQIYKKVKVKFQQLYQIINDQDYSSNFMIQLNGVKTQRYQALIYKITNVVATNVAFSQSSNSAPWMARCCTGEVYKVVFQMDRIPHKFQ